MLYYSYNGVINLNTKLEFVIKKEKNTKTMSAYLVVEDDNQIKHSINIREDVLNLFKFATNFSFENNIYIEKTRSVYKNSTIEKIKFEKGNFIVNNFNRNLITNHSNKYKVNKKVVLGTIIGLVGITSANYISLSDSRGDSNDTTQIENDNLSANTQFTAGISQVFASNPDLSSLDITFDFDDDINSNDNDMMNTSVSVNNRQFNHSSTGVGNIELFSFEYDDRSNSECVSNAKNNMATFNKYGEKYGVDPNLLMAIMCQESGGIHNEYSENGHAIGAFQIENVWDGQTLSAYDFETEEMETICVEFDRLKDFDYNAKVAAMILQLNMRKFDYNVPQAVQAYNMGLSRINGFGDNWNTARLSCDKGDPMYIEHVFSYLPDGYYLTMKKPDGKTTNFIIDNMGSNIYETSVTKQ